MELLHFTLPRDGKFSIPAAWWTEAGMDAFKRGTDLAYLGRPQLQSKPIPLADIEPVSMELRRHLSCAGFDEKRMVGVLRHIATHQEMWPIEITEIQGNLYRYRLHDGTHRFFASVAAGFSHVPALVVSR